MKQTLWLIGLLLLFFGTLSSSVSAQVAWNPKEFMGVDEITTGMTGYGKTVFHGTKIEKFNIEVIGVLSKVDFGFDMILIRVKDGPVVDNKLQTVEGMSGSPIYINDRLIGAYAYGWDFQQEAIAGVTPIAAMLECTSPGSATPPLVGSLVPRNKVLSIGNHLISNIKIAACNSDAQMQQAKADPTTMVLSPVATPLFVNGMADTSLGPLQKLFSRYNMQVMPGPGKVDGPAPTLEAGSAVAVSLMEGDANMSAVGTVTYVKGDTVLCFGHPFIGIGRVDLPMSAAYIHGILSSAKSSFKLASPMGRVGAITSDRQYAVAGSLNLPASTIPISLYLHEPERNFTRRYQVEMMRNQDITPTILYMWVLNSGAGQMGDLTTDQGTFTLRSVISTDKFGDIEQNMEYAPMTATSPVPLGDFYMMSNLLMLNPYDSVQINKVFLDLKYSHERNIAVIEKVTPDREVAHPGETVNLTVKIRPFGKPVEIRTVSVKVPDNASEPLMLVVVAGGTNGSVFKPFLASTPEPEEGVAGIVRWLTENNTPAKSLITMQLYPTPSYAYKGKMLSDAPAPLIEALRYNDIGAAGRGSILNDSDGESRTSLFSDALRPTARLFTVDSPYMLVGGQATTIAIDTEERAMQTSLRSGTDFDLGVQLPVLSTAQTSANQSSEDMFDDGPAGRSGVFSPLLSMLTPLQRTNYSLLKECMGVRTTSLIIPTFSTSRASSFPTCDPLSLSLSPNELQKNIEVDAKPDASQSKNTKKSDTAASDSADTAPDEADSDAKPDEASASENKALLTKKQPSWGLTGRKDFVRGKHLGTNVTSIGNLVIVPSVHTIYQTPDMLPWKIVSSGNFTYVVGWSSNKIIRLDADDKSETFFPKGELTTVKAITALAADADGSVLVGSWPDQHVRLITPDGAVKREWVLPNKQIWDLAITSDGKRYAACDQGMVYLLHDDEKSPLQVACTLPDKHVYTLAAGAHGDIYLGTAPRGKVYHLAANSQLESVYEARGMVTSLAVDADGNVYVGTAPLCRVYRISPAGTQTLVLIGLGRGNHTINALKMVGNDLYVVTGPTGGIYRVVNPAGQEPESTIIFARDDMRDNGDEKAYVGSESVFVNSLTVNKKGEILVAASSPGQVLKLEPRTQGIFLSPAMQAPAVSRWGQLDVLAKVGVNQSVVVDSRSGNTAMPDATWSDWKQVSKDELQVLSPAATFAQFRIHLNGSPDASPALSYLRFYYKPVNQAPVVRIDAPKPGSYWNGTKDIHWEGQDPDGDELVYTVFTSRDNGQTWKQLLKPVDSSKSSEENVEKKESPKYDKPNKMDKPTKTTPTATPVSSTDSESDPAQMGAEKAKIDAEQRKTASEVRDKSIPWDSKSTPDGAYRIKVVATDKYAKPTDPKSAEVISDLFIVDNTPPTISVSGKVTGWDALKRLEIIDNITPVVGGKFNIDGGPWIALTPEDGVFDSTDEWVLLQSPNGEINLTPGEHKVTIQAVDTASNLLDRTITVVIPPKPTLPVAKLLIPPVTGGTSQGLAELMLASLR